MNPKRSRGGKREGGRSHSVGGEDKGQRTRRGSSHCSSGSSGSSNNNNSQNTSHRCGERQQQAGNMSKAFRKRRDRSGNNNFPATLAFSARMADKTPTQNQTKPNQRVHACIAPLHSAPPGTGGTAAPPPPRSRTEPRASSPGTARRNKGTSGAQKNQRNHHRRDIGFTSSSKGFNQERGGQEGRGGGELLGCRSQARAPSPLPLPLPLSFLSLPPPPVSLSPSLRLGLSPAWSWSAETSSACSGTPSGR